MEIFGVVELFFIALGSIATAILAITVRQLGISLKTLRFQAMNNVYDNINKDIKKDLDTIFSWAEKDKEPECILGKTGRESKRIQNNRDILRFVSIAFNKIGYSVFKDLISIDYIQEEIGGHVLKSFIVIKPYLKYERERIENKNQPWNMRRYYLMIVIACENYFKQRNPSYIENAYKKFGSRLMKEEFNSGIPLVPVEWLSNDITKWLRKNNFVK